MHPTPALDQHHDFLALRTRAIDPIVSRHRPGRFIKFQRVRPRVHVVDVRAPTPETRSSQRGDDGGDVERGVLLFRHPLARRGRGPASEETAREMARARHIATPREGRDRSIAREDSTMRCARRTRAGKTGEDEREGTTARARGREKGAGDARDGWKMSIERSSGRARDSSNAARGRARGGERRKNSRDDGTRIDDADGRSETDDARDATVRPRE